MNLAVFGTLRLAPEIIIFNAKFIIFNAKFILFNAKFIIFNANFIIFNAKFIILNMQSSSVLIQIARSVPGTWAPAADRVGL